MASSVNLYEKCVHLDWKNLVVVIVTQLDENEAGLYLPFLALRDKARDGNVPKEIITLLLTIAPQISTTAIQTEIAKTLAVFGREAKDGTELVLSFLREVRISDDAHFWAFDGMLNALGYIAPEEAYDAVDSLEKTNPLQKHGDIFSGKLPLDVAELLLSESFERTKHLIKTQSELAWKKKQTEVAPQQMSPVKRPAWSTR